MLETGLVMASYFVSVLTNLFLSSRLTPTLLWRERERGEGAEFICCRSCHSRLTEEDVKPESLIPLQYVKYQNVQNLTVSCTHHH